MLDTQTATPRRWVGECDENECEAYAVCRIAKDDDIKHLKTFDDRLDATAYIMQNKQVDIVKNNSICHYFIKTEWREK